MTFAQYFQQNGALQSWTVTSTGSSTIVTASAPVYFVFSGVSGLPFAGPESALFTLTATSNQPGNCGVSCGTGDSFVEPGFSGSFSFIDTGAAAGTNLLSGTFSVTGNPSATGAQFSSRVGGTGGSFDASATAGNLNQLVFTSAYLNFANQINETAAWSLSSLIPNFATGPVTANQAYPSTVPYTASGSGTFSADPGPVITTVPAPFSVALLGFGLLGVFGISRARSKSAK